MSKFMAIIAVDEIGLFEEKTAHSLLVYILLY
jgi:hypothetical protein